jgi:hypothetical protein
VRQDNPHRRGDCCRRKSWVAPTLRQLLRRVGATFGEPSSTRSRCLMLKPADGLAVHRVFVFGGREQSRFQPRLVAWSVLVGRQSTEENMQCEQHQSQADAKAAGRTPAKQPKTTPLRRA